MKAEIFASCWGNGALFVVFVGDSVIGMCTRHTRAIDIANRFDDGGPERMARLIHNAGEFKKQWSSAVVRDRDGLIPIEAWANNMEAVSGIKSDTTADQGDDADSRNPK